jgi:3-deoxy-D-manno-octulosonic-acid transferase
VYLVYSVLMGLAAIILTPYWLVQGLRHGKYLSNLKERLGLSFPALENLPAQRSGAIWLHAVSVGEVLAGLTLAKRLKEEFPERPLVVSTTTIAGQALAKERMLCADAVIYFPLDWAFCTKRALASVRPALVVVLETEIWPNFLREASLCAVPVIFVSGRISDRSFSRSQTWLTLAGVYLRPLLRDALGRASGFWMQSEKDAERVRALGAPTEKVRVGGNLKYDLELPKSTPLAEWLEAEAADRGG